LSCRPLRAAPLLGGLVFAGCGHDWDDLDPRLGAGAATTSSATSGAGGATSSQGAGAQGGASSSAASTTTTASASASASVGSGGSTGSLVDRDLLVRYYLDEAESGQGPAEALDAAPNPLPLMLTYVPGMSYASVGGHRGLSWNAIELDGRASAAIATTKIESGLAGQGAATIETVVELSAVSLFNSRISHIGTDNESGRFSLSAGETGTANFFWMPTGAPEPVLAARYPVDFPALGRVVLHLVLYASQADAADRARMFVDGVEVAAVASTPPLTTETIVLAATNHFALGNREIGMRSFVGVLYYSAMYTAALTDMEVQNNAAVLVASDDSP
jgi:hypothetical protein